MPPRSLPLTHFAAGVLWLAAGAGGLILVMPHLVRGAYLAPGVIAVTHCFTLGFMATTIFGALYQLFPVTLGVPARSVRVARWTFWILQAGVAALVAGAALRDRWLLAAGWLLLFFAVGGVSWNLFPQRRKAPRGKAIGRYVVAGHMALGLAMALAGARIGVALGWWRLGTLDMLAAHAHLAAVGFGTLTIVGVGSRLLPMFLLSRGQPEWPLRWIGPLVFLGLIAYSAGRLGGATLLARAGGMATVAGVLLYLFLAAEYFRTRTRKRLDAGLTCVALALSFLAAGTVLGSHILFDGAGPHMAIGYAAIGILGWLVIFVVGVYHKIIPFLFWMDRYSAMVGQPGMPKVSDLTRPFLGFAAGWLLAIGVGMLAAGIMLEHGPAAYGGAAAFAAGTCILLIEAALLIGRPSPRQPARDDNKAS